MSNPAAQAGSTVRNLNDMLSERELCQVAGIEPGARRRPERIAKVLMKAGIFYWFREDGSVGTTWHHIHNPRPMGYQGAHGGDFAIPNFAGMRQ